MKKAKLILLLTIANLLSVNLANAKVVLPAIVSSNMVLQRNTTIKLWGWADANEKISIEASWLSQVLNIEADDKGNWSVQAKTTNSKKPQTIKIRSESTNIILENVANSNIRLFTVKKNASLIPLEDVVGEWLIANPQSVKDFSAVGYFFGKKLNALLDIPIGLIHASWGASRVEAWMDEETLAEFEKIEIAKEIPEKYPQHSPTLLYNGMLHPLQDYSIKGVVWYQGESNITKAEEYLRLFPALVKQWRNQWRQEKSPFYYVQIAPFKYWGNSPVYLREAQLKSMQLIENAGMVVTLDIGDCEFIHPPEKRIIGDRLAYWALSKDYGFEGIAYSGPVYKNFEITQDGKINLFFDYCPNGLSSFGIPLAGFEIAGNDKIFHPATATINENRTVTVFSEEVATPVAARYAFIPCPTGTLFNIEGLPASSFRTDDWDE